ncbi:MAG: LysR family transcriptional regulator [Betaproteobacteria bacterium]
MGLTLEALAVLDAIDRRGSFAAAAVELGRVPSAITYTIRTLEDTLDVLLFDRRGHRARLTPAGRILLDDGRRLLAAARDTEARVRRVATGWETELRVAVDVLIPWACIFPLVAAFYSECAVRQSSHTQLKLSREVFGGSWDALADGRADLAIGAAGDAPPGGGYRLRLLAEVTSPFVVAPTHPLAAATKPLTESDIAAHRAVVAADSSRHLAPRSLGILSGQNTLTVPDLDSKLAAQVAGLGSGFLPASIAAPDIAAGRLVIKTLEHPRPALRINAAWRTPRPGNALAWWIEAVTHADWRYLAMARTDGPITSSVVKKRSARG